MSQKITEDLCVITLKNDAKFEEELTCALKNDIRNWAHFNQIKVYNAFAGKVQRSYA